MRVSKRGWAWAREVDVGSGERFLVGCCCSRCGFRWGMGSVEGMMYMFLVSFFRFFRSQCSLMLLLLWSHFTSQFRM